MNISWFKSKKYVTNSIFIKKALELKLSLEEFLMLTYFDNDYSEFLNIEEVCKNLGLKLEEAYKVFNNLLSKKLIDVESTNDLEGRMLDKVNLENFYQMLSEDKIIETKKQQKTDIFGAFEREFGRTINGMEYEIINAWLEKGYSEELIEGALKEAVFNGVKKLRYIDKILYEWSKQGFKTMNDVNNHLQNREPEIERKELFDYNWLEDDE